MKTCILFALSAFTTALPAVAQPVRFGIEAGGSYTWLRFDEPLEEWNLTGRPFFPVLGFVHVNVSDRIGFQTGLKYTFIGDRGTFEITIQDEYYFSRFRRTTEYLIVPVRAKAWAIRNRLYVIAGPEFGYLLSATSWLKRETLEQEPELSAVTDQYRRVNVAVTTGVGSSFRIVGRDVYVQASYSHGLSDLRKGAAFQHRSSELVLSIGYML